MHMADALISPAVGGTFWAISGGLIAYCARKVKQSIRDNIVPMMGVMGAFVFAAQMINFSIPGTGSSGHLGGGLLLTILLGPYAALLVIASVLTVQAFFFADGGLLALGCNIFNLGLFPAFIAYPLIYQPLVRNHNISGRAWSASVSAAVAGLLMGASSVVVQTMASGISDLPFGTFAMLMLPIHLAIGVMEGLATAAVVSFVKRARPESLAGMEANAGIRPVVAGLLIATFLIGGAFSWFASSQPDGLEWSISKSIGSPEPTTHMDDMHQRLADVQQKTAILPDYSFKNSGEESTSWPEVSAGTSASGIVGGLITLILAGTIGFLLKLKPAETRYR
jgi:cobalt/nickel transport system permease protein